MKVTIRPDGSVEFDVDTVEQAVELARSVQVDDGAETAAAAELNDKQYATWQSLIDLDNGKGVHVSALARSLGINAQAASARCANLVKLGYGERMRVGYYRAKA